MSRLYTVNKWNRKKFLDKNIFDDGGVWDSLAQKDFQKNPWNYSQDYLYGGNGPSITEQYKNSKNGLGISKESNPFSKGNIGGTMKSIGAAASTIPETPFKLGNTTYKRGLWDAADPLYQLAGNKENVVGNTFSDAGVSMTKAGLQSGNGWVALAGGITKALGSLINAGWGIEEDKSLKAGVDAGIKYNSNFMSTAGSFDDLVNPYAVVDNGKVYTGGWFTKGKARRKNEELKRDIANAKSYAEGSVGNNIYNINDDMRNYALRNYAAFGGPLGNPFIGYPGDDTNTAVGYDLANYYLTTKKTQAENKGGTNIPNYSGIYASGGKIHINPKNKGKFNAIKKRTGKTTEELTHSKNPLTRKRAIFAQNARKWRHDFGGPLFALGGPEDVAQADATYVSKPLVYEKSRPQLMRKVVKHTFLPIEQQVALAQAEAKQEVLDAALDNFFAGKPMPKVGRKLEAITRKLGEGDEEYIQQLAKTPLRRLTAPFNEGREEYLQTNRPFAFGGDLQTNGSDFPTGLTHIGTGGSHESNPYEGVQMGVDSEGVPNLVEENEVVYDDYVFSNRIPIDQYTKDKFHIGKKREMTFADLAKKLEKEIAERPNDPLSEAGFNAQMQTLQEEQERQKQEMEAERAREAFEALPPEEQVAIMDRANQEEQMAQQAMQEQAMAQQAAEQQGMVQQPTPEEAAMAQQQMISEAETVAAPQMQAMGGRKYDTGGGLLDTVVEMEDPTMGTFGGIVVTPKNNEKKAALQINPLAFIDASKRREEIEERDNRDRRIEEYLDRLEDWLDTGRRNRSKIHYYAPGGELDNDWYNSLAPEYKWLVDQYKLTDANSLGRMPIAFQNALVKLYQRMQAVKDNPEYSDFSLAAANSNNFIKDDDFYTSLKNKGYDSFGFYDLTPEQWQSVYNDYLERHPTPQAIVQESSEVESKGERVSLKDRIDRIIDNISRRRAERKARRAERREDRQQTREERRQARLEAQEQDRLEKEQMHQLRALAREQVAVEKAAMKQQKREQKEQLKAAKNTLNGKSPATNESYYHNGEPTTLREVPILPSRTPQTTVTLPDEELQDYTNRGGILTTTPPLTPQSTNNGVTTIPTPRYWYNGQGYDDETEYYRAILDEADKYGISQVDSNLSIRPTEDIIKYIEEARKGIGGGTQPKAPAAPEVPSLATPTLTGNPVIDELNSGQGKPIRTVVKGGTPIMPIDDSLSERDRASLYNFIMSPEGQETVRKIKEKQTSGSDEGIPAPKDNWMRYAGLFGPAVGLGLMAAGVGKPDYSRLDAALASLGEPVHADWKPIGNYLTYRPMDIWYEQNRLNANARATDRYITNNAAPIGTKMAGLIANAYNNQLASGNLFRQALEYNDNKKAQVEGFNRGTDQFNSQAYNQNSMFNAQADNMFNQAKARLGLAAAQTRLDNDAGWYNSLYGNIGGLFKGIGDLGRDKTEKNWLEWLEKRGAFGNTGRAAYGGKIKPKKHRRGFTY